jgi:trigger factor
VDRLRDRFARLEDVDRAAQTGDFLVVDYDATLDGDALEGAQGRAQLVELGAGRLLPSLETGLVGASAGETPEIVATFPADYPSNEIAGRQAIFTVAVKQVKEKRLPELDEDFAADTGFDTVEELRADIASRMTDAELERIDREFREAALDEVARDATVEVPAALITARAAEMWERTQRALARQGISRETYLQISGRDEAQLLAELAPDAEQALRREAVITAVVAAEGIVPSDDELLEVLAESADAHDHDHDHGAHDHDHGAHDHDHSAHADHDHDHGDHDPTIEAQKLMDELRRGGRLEELRDELAARHAVDLIARESKPIAAERAEARARLWTPDKEGGDGLQDPSSTPSGAQSGPGAAPKRLWTPGA